MKDQSSRYVNGGLIINPMNIAKEDRPDFNDLIDNSESGPIRRVVARYLFSRDPERSVKRHTRMGAPLVRKAVMGTIGKAAFPGPHSNYRTDYRKFPTERFTRFAVGGSVINEAAHTTLALSAGSQLVNSLIEGRSGSVALYTALTGLNGALVSLQRYNRARMVEKVNAELGMDDGFPSTYRNWLGIDSRAVENYKASLEASQVTQDMNPDLPPSLEQPAPPLAPVQQPTSQPHRN